MRIFDGHNDVLSQLQREGQGITPFLEGRAGHIDALKCRKGGMVGGLFAVYVPSPSPGGSFLEQLQAPSYDLALPGPIPWTEALPVALEQVLKFNKRLWGEAVPADVEVRDCYVLPSGRH